MEGPLLLCSGVPAMKEGTFKVKFPYNWPNGQEVVIQGTSYDYELAYSNPQARVTSDPSAAFSWRVRGNQNETVEIWVLPKVNGNEIDPRTPVFTFRHSSYAGIPSQGSASVFIDDFDERSALRLEATVPTTREGSLNYGRFDYGDPRVCTFLSIMVDATPGSNKATPWVDYKLRYVNGPDIPLQDADGDGIWRAGLSGTRDKIEVVAFSDLLIEGNETVDAALYPTLFPSISTGWKTVTIQDVAPSLGGSDAVAEEPNLIYCSQPDPRGSVVLNIPPEWIRGSTISIRVFGTAIQPRDYNLDVYSASLPGNQPISYNFVWNSSINEGVLDIVVPLDTSVSQISIEILAKQNYIEADSGRTVKFALRNMGTAPESTITITDVLESGQLTASPNTTQEGSLNYGTYRIRGGGGEICASVILEIDTNIPSSATPGSDYVLKPKNISTPLDLIHVGSGLYRTRPFIPTWPFSDIDLVAELDNLLEGTEKARARLIIPSLTNQTPPVADISITEDANRHKMILSDHDRLSEEPPTIYCPTNFDPFGAVKITVPPVWQGGTVSIQVSTQDPTPGVDFTISGVSYLLKNNSTTTGNVVFNITTGILNVYIGSDVSTVYIHTTALGDNVEIDPETIQFSWGQNSFPNIIFTGSGAVEIDDDEEGIGLTSDPSMTYEFWGADAPGKFHIKPDDASKKICTSVRLKIDATGRNAATPGADYGMVDENGNVVTLDEIAPKIYLTGPLNIQNDNDFVINVIAVQDKIREGDELVKAELVVASQPNEHDKADVTIKEEYLKAEIRKEEAEDPQCKITCPISVGDLVKIDVATPSVESSLLPGFLTLVSDPMKSAYPEARLVIPLKEGKAVPTHLDVVFNTVKLDASKPLGYDIRRELKAFRVNVSALVSDEGNAPQPKDKLFLNFQLDLLPEMLSGGPLSFGNVEVVVHPTFAPNTPYLQKFNGWWCGAPFGLTNPFAMEQLTGLPPSVAFGFDRLIASTDALRPNEDFRFSSESGSMQIRPNGTQSWFVGSSSPESLMVRTGNKLTTRDGADILFVSTADGLPFAIDDQAKNRTQISNIARRLSQWGTGGTGAISGVDGRSVSIDYAAPSAGGSSGRTFAVTDPWGAVTTIQWVPSGTWAPSLALPSGYNRWRVDASPFTESAGGVLTVTYPDPDGSGPRKALQNVYNFSTHWFLSSIQSGEVGSSPIQNYSFSFHFDPTKPAGEIGSRGLLSVTHNGLTWNVDFSRRLQELSEAATPYISNQKLRILAYDKPDKVGYAFADITSITDPLGNRTLFRADHRGRPVQVMDAYFVKLLGLDTLNLSNPLDLKTTDNAMKVNAGITTSYELSITSRDGWGKVTGQDLGDVNVLLMPDPDDFTLRLDLPANTRTNGPLDRPRIESEYANGNRLRQKNPLINDQTWVYNEQFDIPTVFTDEHGNKFYQEVDASVGKVKRIRSGFTSPTNPVKPLDVDNSGMIDLWDVLTLWNFLNLNGGSSANIAAPFRVNQHFLDANGDGVINRSDANAVENFINSEASDPPLPNTFERWIAPTDMLGIDFEYSSISGLPKGLLTKLIVPQNTEGFGPSIPRITSFEYYNTPGVTATHGMLLKEIVSPGATQLVTTYFYDSRANVSKTIDPAGVTTHYFYDTLDRLTSVVGADPDGGGPLISPMIRFDYNVYGRLIAKETINSYLDEQGLLVVTSTVDGYEYDNFQRLIGSYEQRNNLTWYVTGIGSNGVSRSQTPGATSQNLDLLALGAANPRITTGASNVQPVTPANSSDERGLVVETTYDGVHNPKTVRTSSGGADVRVLTLNRDALGRPTMTVSPAPGGSEAMNVPNEVRNADASKGEVGGYVSTIIYDNLSREWRVTDTHGNSIDRRLDQLGRVMTVSSPGSTSGSTLTTSFNYTSIPNTGWKVQTTDPLNISISVTYDFAGRQKIVESPSGKFGWMYNVAGQMKYVVDDSTNFKIVQQNFFNEQGQLRTTSRPIYGSLMYTYEHGRLKTVQNSSYITQSSYTYDSAGRVSQITGADPDGFGPLSANSTYAKYDSLGNVIDSRDDIGPSKKYFYNSRQQLVKSVDEAGFATSFSYDVYGNTLSVSDAKGNVTSFDYDRLGRQFKETKGTYGSRISQLDGLGNTRQLTDRNGRVTTFDYNQVGNLVKETWVGNNREFNFSYDQFGRLTSAMDAATGTTTFQYDALGFLDKEIMSNAWWNKTVELDSAYNNRGERTEVKVKIDGVTDLTNSYTYAYTGAGYQLSSVDQFGTNVRSKYVTFNYLDDGRLSNIGRNRIVTTFTYDQAKRLTGIEHARWNSQSPEVLDNYAIDYDQANRISSVSSSGDKFKASYSYDTRDQVIGSVYTPLGTQTPAIIPPNENYAFDGTGNRQIGGNSTSEDETHNRVQSANGESYSYDNEGNLISRTSTSGTTTYEYDFRNRLVKVTMPGKIVAYQYDVFDRRTGKTVDEGGNNSVEKRVLWIWDGQQLIHQHIDSDGDGSAPFELKNRYLYANMVDMILADELVGIPDPSATVSVGIGGGTATQPNQVLWPLTDHQGSVRTILNHSREVVERRVYDTFGNRVLPQSGNGGGGGGSSGPGEPGGTPGGSSGTTNSIAADHLFGYTGREWDSDIGLQYNRARWYDPKQGRWISQDPIGFAAGDENLYRYVGNGPTNATDPSGLAEHLTGLPLHGSSGHWFSPDGKNSGPQYRGNGFFSPYAKSYDPNKHKTPWFMADPADTSKNLRIRYTNGVPDFSRWARKATINGKSTVIDVEITLDNTKDKTDQSRRYADDSAATEEFRRTSNNKDWKKPDGYTWHHQTIDPKTGKGRMILVNSKVHSVAGHWGPYSLYRDLLIAAEAGDRKTVKLLMERAKSLNLVRLTKVVGGVSLIFSASSAYAGFQQGGICGSVEAIGKDVSMQEEIGWAIMLPNNLIYRDWLDMDPNRPFEEDVQRSLDMRLQGAGVAPVK